MLNRSIHELAELSGKIEKTDHIIEKIDGLCFKIGAKSFFQTNIQQAKILYQKTKELAKITEHDLIYDLYTGTGTIAQYVAKSAAKVIGIDLSLIHI